LTELKRRNVYRAAVAYGVGAWFLTQLTTQVFPFFEIPNSAVRFVVIALAIGFPIAMLLSWLYEFTPEGVVRTEDLQPHKQDRFSVPQARIARRSQLSLGCYKCHTMVGFTSKRLLRRPFLGSIRFGTLCAPIPLSKNYARKKQL
jgi:hypothetical protein